MPDTNIKTTGATVISSSLSWKDRLGNCKLRWGIGRKDSIVSPGLYALGNPDKSSPVFVSANYSMSFDVLRGSLTGINCWILVIDTRGINVWCAAGKGTFGTDEIIHRVLETNLADIVDHNKIILPQLSAPGVAAHKVTAMTGFKVQYGPVRVQDIPEFLKTGLKTSAMRTVTFSIKDRLVLTPLELVQSGMFFLFIIPYVFLFHFFAFGEISPSIIADLLRYSGSVLVGAIAAPLLLPVLPGRALSLKGGILGAVYALITGFSLPLYETGSTLLLFPAITAFIHLNFTGATTYTSLSGVEREMKFAIPVIILMALLGIAVKITGLFL